MRRPIVHSPVIKECRTGLGLTLKSVADEIKVAASTVFEAEAGCDVTLVVARKFADFYGKPVDELWPVKKQKK